MLAESKDAYKDYSFVLDIDGTLCPIKGRDEKYEDVVPYKDMVQKVRWYKERGAKIVLYTSRNMNSYKGNIGLINKHTAAILTAWLKKWDIPYDEIIYGKVWPGYKGFYVDDRTVRPDEFLSRTTEELDAICTASRLDHKGGGSDTNASIACLSPSPRFVPPRAIFEHRQCEAIPRPASSRMEAAERNTDIVITMAGEGSRFRQAGWNVPKYMVKTRGKTLFEWSMESLSAFAPYAARWTFVVKKDETVDAAAFINDKCGALGISAPRIIVIDYLTCGQAETALLASDGTDDNALLVYNIDTYVESGYMTPPVRSRDCPTMDGYIPCFKAEGTHWSFVRLDDSGQAVEIKEKERISENCTIGAYWFCSWALYKHLYHTLYGGGDNLVKGERYIAPMYNLLVREGGNVRIAQVDSSRVHVLGTPEELMAFERGES